VLRCANRIQREYGEEEFTVNDLQKSMRRVLIDNYDCGKQPAVMFGTNEPGNVMAEAAVVSQIKGMFRQRYGDGATKLATFNDGLSLLY
jgi:hypothetical protein